MKSYNCLSTKTIQAQVEGVIRYRRKWKQGIRWNQNTICGLSDFKLNFNGRAANPDNSAGNLEIKVDAGGLLEDHLVYRSSDKQERPGGGVIIRTVLISSFNQQTKSATEIIK